MDSVSQVASSARSSSSLHPTHQPIGRNGSFWLPPKSNVSFESNLNKQSRENGPKPSPSDKSSEQAKLPSLPKAKRWSANSPQLNSHKNVPVTVKGSASPIISKLLSQNSLATKKLPPRVTMPVANRGTQSAPDRALILVPPKEAKTTKEIPVDKSSRDLPSEHENTGSKDHGKKKKGGGTKNALKHMSMNATESNLTATAFSGKSDSLNHSTAQKALKQFVQDAIPPRIAYISKFDRKVIRFALDLPNGGKLGVRLQKDGTHLSLSLICPDLRSKEQLSFLDGDSLSGINGLKISVYSSYQEMDSLNPLAA